jgi:hypothetical protein
MLGTYKELVGEDFNLIYMIFVVVVLFFTNDSEEEGTQL